MLHNCLILLRVYLSNFHECAPVQARLFLKFDKKGSFLTYDVTSSMLENLPTNREWSETFYSPCPLFSRALTFLYALGNHVPEAIQKDPHLFDKDALRCKTRRCRFNVKRHVYFASFFMSLFSDVVRRCWPLYPVFTRFYPFLPVSKILIFARNWFFWPRPVFCSHGRVMRRN